MENGYNFNKQGGEENKERQKQLYKLSTAKKYGYAIWSILNLTSSHQRDGCCADILCYSPTVLK